jgi:hypothetical protein
VYRKVAAYFHYVEVSVKINALATLSQGKAPHLVVVKRCGGLLNTSGICEKFNTNPAENQI